jgi:hypothetical protein
MLYRREAVEHFYASKSEGQILLRCPAVLWGCSVAALTLCAAVLAILFFASHTQRLRMAGQILPAAPMASTAGALVRIWVPRDLLPALKNGGRLPLYFPALPHADSAHCDGTIAEISRVPVTDAKGQARYGVTLRTARPSLHIEGADYPLSPGMEVTADISLGKKRLVSWIFSAMSGKEAAR